MENEGLMDVKELARYLSMSVRAIWRMRDAGTLPRPLTLGRAVRWNRAQISEWISNGAKPCRPAISSTRRNG